MDVSPTRAEATAETAVLSIIALQTLADKETYLSVLLFSDRVFITVSQFLTFGTMMVASQTDEPDGTSTLKVRTVLGAPSDEEHADGLELIASRLAECTQKRYGLPLFLGCGLQRCDLNIARDVVGACESLLDRVGKR